MLDFLRRHHKTFWIVVTVVVIISFTFWGATSKTGAGRGRDVDDSIVTIYGRDYDRTDVNRLIRFRGLAMQLGMYDFAQQVGYISYRFGFIRQDYPLDFAINLVVLHKAMETYGVKVSDAEANEAFRKLRVFQTKDGEFDGARAQRFQDEMLGAMGFKVEDVLDLMRDSVGFQKLQKLVGGNVVVNPALSEKNYAELFQTIHAMNIPFALDDFKKKAQVSDDEIAKYFEQNKTKFNSEPMRAISYVYFLQPKDLDAGTPEERMKKQNAFAQKVNDFSADTIKDPSKFDTLAKAQSLEVHPVPAFAQDGPPEALKEETALVGDVFSSDPKTHPVSDPIKGKDGFYIYKINPADVKEAKPQELKEVKDKIKDALVAQKAQENMMKEASDVRKKLEEAVKAGKKIADAAKEAGVQPQPITDFSPARPPTDLSNGKEIATEAAKTPAGGFTKPINADNGVIVVYVESKTLYKSDESAKLKQSVARRDDNQTEGQIFQTWFEKRRDEADAKPHLQAQNG